MRTLNDINTIVELTTTTSRAALSILCVSVALSGCSFLSVSDGSLDYQDATLLDPLVLPADKPTRQFKPLYEIPMSSNVNTLKLSNPKGNRYQLPAPAVQIIRESDVATP